MQKNRTRVHKEQQKQKIRPIFCIQIISYLPLCAERIKETIML